MGWVGYGMVWYGDVCVFVITASATLKWERMTLENCGFPEYICGLGLYRMGTYDVVSGCHPAGEHHYKILL